MISSRTHRGVFLKLFLSLGIFVSLTIWNTSNNFFITNDKSVTFIQDICSCNITIGKTEDNNVVQPNQTTCSQDAFRRGTGQKVIGFSFYEKTSNKEKRLEAFRKNEEIPLPLYFHGIKTNLKLMPQFYPNWIMRLYIDLDQVVL